MNSNVETPGIAWAVPEELGVPPDKLRLRLDFFHQATTITYFEEDTVVTKIVDAIDVAHALASDLTFSTGLLPDGILWWSNTRSGPMFAIYTGPRIRKVALQVSAGQPPKRYTVPLPGLIFLCSPSQPPWVYAVKKKPTRQTDVVYKAPLANIYDNGRSCPGSHKYPARVADMVQSFFMSFFSRAGDRGGRSVKFPNDVLLLWNFLNGKKKYPMDDLMPHGTLKDLMSMEIGSQGRPLDIDDIEGDDDDE